MDFDVEGARQAGYNDTEIADHLAKSRGFDARGARKAGYSDADILQHLGAAPVNVAASVNGRAVPATLERVATPRAKAADTLTAESLTPTGTFAENAMAGAGKAVADAGRGIKQIAQKVGNAAGLVSDSTLAATQRDIDEAAARDKALMETGGGVVGNIGGNVAMTLLPGGVLRAAGGAATGTAGTLAALRGAGAITGGSGAATALGTAGNLLARVGTAINAPATLKGAAAVGAGLGAIGPVTSEEGEAGRLKSAAAGAAGGAGGVLAGRMLAAAMQGGKALVEPFTRGGQENIVGRTLQRFTDDPQATAGALRAARELVPGSVPNAAEASGSTGLATLIEALKAANPQVKERFTSLAMDQNAARLAALRGVAGTPDDITAAISARSKETAPLRDAALREANYGSTKTASLADRLRQKTDSVIAALRDKGRFQTFAGQQEDLANTVAAVPGMPRGAGRYSLNADRASEGVGAAAETAGIEAQRKAERAFLEMQLNSLRQAGYSPLQVAGITGQIDGVVNQPGLRASDVVSKTLGDLRDKLAGLADAAGNIDARDLYTVRKEIGNTISKHAKESANWDKNLAAGLERDLQRSIDAAIERAGAGPLWQQYLSKYQELSKPVDRLKIGQELLKRATSAAENVRGDPRLYNEAFAGALRADNDLVTAATGFGQNKGLASIMTPAQMDTLAAIRADSARSANAAAGARATGSNTAQNLAGINLLRQILGPLGLPESFSEARVLPTLMRPVNWAMRSQDQVIQDELAKALMDRGIAAKLLERAQAQQAPSRIGTTMQRALPAVTGAAAASVP